MKYQCIREKERGLRLKRREKERERERERRKRSAGIEHGKNLGFFSDLSEKPGLLYILIFCTTVLG